jgi:hypothetical protein
METGAEYFRLRGLIGWYHPLNSSLSWKFLEIERGGLGLAVFKNQSDSKSAFNHGAWRMLS